MGLNFIPGITGSLNPFDWKTGGGGGGYKPPTPVSKFDPSSAYGQLLLSSVAGGGQNPNWARYMDDKYRRDAAYMADQKSLEAQAAEAGINSQVGLRAASPAGNILGYGNLLQLLANQGRTDPRLMNAQMAQVQQSTQGAQMQQQGMAARQGFQNSGVNAALQAGLANAGNARQSDLMARDAQLAEERRRQDLDLFNQLILGPSRDYTAMALGQYAQNKQADAQEKGGKYAALGGLLGGLAAAFCWVAQATLEDEHEVNMCRIWMLRYAPDSLREQYREVGPRVAEMIRENPEMREQFRPIFKAMAANVVELLDEDYALVPGAEA